MIKQKIGYITIKVIYDDRGKFQDITEDMRYYMDHDDILETEIIDIDYDESEDK